MQKTWSHGRAPSGCGSAGPARAEVRFQARQVFHRKRLPDGFRCDILKYPAARLPQFKENRRQRWEHRTEYDLKAIGRNLKHLRESRHLTVEQVREYLCLGSVQAVYKYESGTGYPQADTLLALMELYGAGVDDIVRGHEEEQGSSFGIFDIYGIIMPRRKVPCWERLSAI